MGACPRICGGENPELEEFCSYNCDYMISGCQCARGTPWRLNGTAQCFSEEGCPRKGVYNHPSCTFPFLYNGVTYNECTSTEHTRLWCSTTQKYEGSWVNCNWQDHCASLPCLNGGNCTASHDYDDNYDFTCACAEGFAGSQCETVIEPHPCDREVDPCNENGLCVRQGEGYSCQCLEYYSGENCEIRPHPCDVLGRKKCNDRGECIKLDTELGYKCACPIIFAGQHCERVITLADFKMMFMGMMNLKDDQSN